ncbi:MAG TPA: DoxX family protein [Bacteroidia bacterium]|nr:DoxX family protein [Bacteroidia bacterium]
MKYLVLAGRIFFSLLFLMTLMGHFKQQTIDYVSSQGVPAASYLVPLSGIIASVGALSIILGYKAKAGAWLLIIFLFPVTFYMHAFWKETDSMKMQMQMANFMKNLSLIGAALLISYFGSGPLSIDKEKTAANQEK